MASVALQVLHAIGGATAPGSYLPSNSSKSRELG